MIRFYQNKATKEVISKSELTMMENWREQLETLYEPYSEYHPILKGLPVAKIPTEYSNPREKTEFMVVPLQMILDNIEDQTIWEGCPRLFNQELYDCIKAIKEREEYPYNSTVAEEFCKRYGVQGGEDDFLSAIVYTTQSYKHLEDAEYNTKLLHEEMTAEGYEKLTEELILSAVGTKRRFLVLLNGTNVMGGETNIKSESYLYLKDNNNGGFIWMKPRATRNGYRATLGQYVKEVTK